MYVYAHTHIHTGTAGAPAAWLQSVLNHSHDHRADVINMLIASHYSVAQSSLTHLHTQTRPYITQHVNAYIHECIHTRAPKYVSPSFQHVVLSTLKVGPPRCLTRFSKLTSGAPHNRFGSGVPECCVPPDLFCGRFLEPDRRNICIICSEGYPFTSPPYQT